MSARLVPLFLLLLFLPAVCQQPNLPSRGKVWTSREIHPEPLRQQDIQASRVRSIHQDAQELSGLNAELQSELQQVEKGLLPSDLAAHLKKIEKLSKKLRQEVER